jgi:uncharacterized membrane protein YcaP (DUF421 family)
MKKEEIKLNDVVRILFGDAPPIFVLEVFIRVTFFFILLLVCMRLLGKRVPSHLSRNERVALSSLGAAIGIPLQAPDRGLLPALLVALLVVMLQKLVAAAFVRFPKMETLSQGKIATLVSNGVVDTHAIKSTRISRERIVSALRAEGVAHLGMVGRLFIEAGGGFTLIKRSKPAPGLSIIPLQDAAYYKKFTKTRLQVCGECGKEQEDNTSTCSNCGNDHFTEAITRE